jgi:hypothetical protein
VNADLIGKTFTDDETGFTHRVVGVWDVMETYVLVHDGYQEHLRPAGVVRRAIELEPASRPLPSQPSLFD